MNYLKQSTITTIQLGPFLDEDDGKTAETALTITSTDVWLSKGGAAFANPSDTAAAAHDRVGWYRKQINATDTAMLGRLIVSVHEAGALPVWREFMVVEANWYDAMCAALGTGYVEVESDALGSTQMANSVAAKGVMPTLHQAIYMILQILMEKAATGTTVTIDEIDGATELMTFLLDHATNPTSISRAT